MPSVSLFQYAPVALCIPLLPRSGATPLLALGAVGVVGGLASCVPSACVLVPTFSVPGALDVCESLRCCIIVELTAYLYCGFCAGAGAEVEAVAGAEVVREVRILLMMEAFQVSVWG